MEMEEMEMDPPPKNKNGGWQTRSGRGTGAGTRTEKRNWKKGRRRGRLSETRAELATPPPLLCGGGGGGARSASSDVRVSHDAPSAAFRTTTCLDQRARGRAAHELVHTHDCARALATTDGAASQKPFASSPARSLARPAAGTRSARVRDDAVTAAARSRAGGGRSSNRRRERAVVTRSAATGLLEELDDVRVVERLQRLDLQYHRAVQYSTRRYDLMVERLPRLDQQCSTFHDSSA